MGMQAQRCRRRDDWTRAIMEIGRDPRRRREWLWLRARQKQDDESIEMLERADAGLRERMRPIDEQLALVDDDRARGEAYGREMDRMLPDGPCDCRRCVSERFAGRA
jgi:hypothetical protein